MDETIEKTILCVEDEPEMIDLMQLILSRRGYQVKGARGGVEGIQLIRELHPDLVLLDLMMPDMDGWEVYKEMQADDSLRQIPVIIVTARNSSFEEIIARERAGVSDYLTKPFLPNDLRKSLAQVLNAAKQ